MSAPTAPTDAQAAARKRATWPLWLGVGACGVLVLLLVVGEGLYLARRSIGRQAALGWLRERGVDAELDIERLDLDGFTGRVRLGPAAKPEVTVERAEVRYRVTGFWNGLPLGVEVGEVRLVRPVAHASLRGGKFSVGQLDRVLDEFRRAPPRPDARQPKVSVEDARLVVVTDYGLADIDGSARLEDGKLLSLSAGLKPTALRVGALKAALNGGRLSLTTVGDRVKVDARFGADSLAFQSFAADGASIGVRGDLPYPDFKARRGDGRVTLAADAAAERLAADGTTLRTTRFDLAFNGAAQGWIDSLSASGTARAGLTAAALAMDDLSLTNLVANGAGPAALKAGEGASARLAGSARARGAWPVMGPPAKADDPSILAVKRLLGGFDLSAPGLDVALGEGIAVRLTQPARIASPGGGGLAVATAQGRGPLFDGIGGSLGLSLSGGGMPSVKAAVSRYDLTPRGVTATADLAIKGSLGPLIEAEVATNGRLAVDGETVTYAAVRCAPFTLARLELGVNDVERLAGNLCETNAPTLVLKGETWRLRARVADLSAAAPFLEAQVAEGAGTLDLSGAGEAFEADVAIADAQVIDAAAVGRFNPVRLTGQVTSRGGDWTGDLAVADGVGHALATAKLTHAGLAERGGLVFDTGVLTFMDEGLQPGALSPLAAPLGAPVTGRARFQGQIGWVGETSTGDGVLTLEDIGFRSPAGAISGLAGRIAFTSLDPLISASGQTLTVARVAALAPLTDLTARFALDASALKLDAAELTLGGGRLRLDPLSIPLVPGTWEGRLQVNGVQLADLVKASPFADRVDVDAKVSGMLPFVVTPQGVRVIEGRLAAVQPGRISIHREALSGVSAAGGATIAPDAPGAAASGPVAPPTDTITDFAYQAMENLAFDKLDVTLNSLPGGRLGALFHIEGRHEPPTRQELRLGLAELITKRFLQRSLPLPSDTPVNLTLDTSLNLDEVLRDVAATRTPASSNGSATVQP